MTIKYEIRDSDPNGVLVPTLADILSRLDAPEEYQWSLLDIEAVGDVTTRWPQGIVWLEEQINDAGSLNLTWDELSDLATMTTQVINCELRGKRDGATVVIRAVDSTLWEIELPNRTLGLPFETSFSDCRRST
jgi:hypothetical protein